MEHLAMFFLILIDPYRIKLVSAGLAAGLFFLGAFAWLPVIDPYRIKLVSGLLLIIILIFLCGGFSGWGWNHEQYGPYARGGVGLTTILLIVLIVMLLR